MKPLNLKINNMLQRLNIDVSQFWEIIWKFFVGALFSICGFFEPVKDIVHLLIAFFIIDMLAGFWANKVVKQEKFKMSKIWATTFPRMLISLVLIMMTFWWDNVFGQTAIKTYWFIGYFISGVLLANILQNSYRATRWGILLNLAEFIKNIFKDKGVDINETDPIE